MYLFVHVTPETPCRNMRVPNKEESIISMHLFLFPPLVPNIQRSHLSCVVDLRNNDVCSTHRAQIIHDARNALLLNHCLHSNPGLVVQASNCGRTLAGSDLRGVGEVLALDVVGAKHELLRGDHTLDAVGDQVDELRV